MDNSWTSNDFLFSFEGRINRAKYWYALFASMISCGVFLAVLASALGAIFGVGVESVHLNVHDIFSDPRSLPFGADFSNTGPASTRILTSVLFYVGGIPIFVVGMWFLTATTVKRLHDRNKSGWWIVPFFVAPNLLGKVGGWLGDSYPVNFLTLILGVLSLWAFVEMLCLRGTKGPNRFGPDPLAPIALRAPGAPVETRPRWDQQSELEFVPHSAGPSPGEHVKRGHD
jgi:uncharacterized membrane protein YhaH (DUF805 family)